MGLIFIKRIENERKKIETPFTNLFTNTNLLLYFYIVYKYVVVGMVIDN